jgi:hypothetical protein
LPIARKSQASGLRHLSAREILGTFLSAIGITLDRKLPQDASRSTHCDIGGSGDHDFSDRDGAAAIFGRR